MLLGIVLLPVMNAIAKSLTADYPLTQVVWARFLGHLVWVSLFFGPFLGVALLRAHRPREMIGRSFVFFRLLRLQFCVHRRTALHPPASCITFLSEQAFAPQNTRFWSRRRVWFQFTVGEDKPPMLSVDNRGKGVLSMDCSAKRSPL